LIRKSPILVTYVLNKMSVCWFLSLVISVSLSRSIVSSSLHRKERSLRSSIDGASGDVTANTARPRGSTPTPTMKNSIGKSDYISTNRDIRVLKDYTGHTVFAHSLTQELYGIIDFPERTTTTFQEIYDEYVESYFSLNVNPSLLLDSSITITRILVPSTANRYLKRQWKNLEIFRALEGKHAGSSVIIVYDQQLSYYFPTESGILTLESLVTLPFLTESARNEFNSRLKRSDDLVLQDVIGVSEVDLPSQSPAAQSSTSKHTQIPVEPVAEVDPPPQLSTNQPSSSTKRPTEQPANSSTISPSMRPLTPPGQTPDARVKPTSIPTKLPVFTPPPPKSPASSPSQIPATPPTTVPVFVPTITARPTLVSTKADILDTAGRSGGFSGLVIIGSIMAVLFIVFAINMKYCMGEYVD